jgi:hypothetical protein
VAEHLQTCGGNAVIVFDEVQKVRPGTLEVGNSITRLRFPLLRDLL